MQAYMQSLSDRTRYTKDEWLLQYINVCLFCCRTAAISVSFTPLLTFRFQSLSVIAIHSIDVDITFHYVTSQFSAFSLTLTDSALLSISWHCSQILTFLSDINAHKSWHSHISVLLADIARRFRSVGSYMQSFMAFSRCRWRSHEMNQFISSYLTSLSKCLFSEHINKSSRYSQKIIKSQIKHSWILSINKIFTSLSFKIIWEAI